MIRLAPRILHKYALCTGFCFCHMVNASISLRMRTRALHQQRTGTCITRSYLSIILWLKSCVYAFFHRSKCAGYRTIHSLNMELDLQSLFGLLCTAILIGWDPAVPPLLPAFGLIYEGAIGQSSVCDPLLLLFAGAGGEEPAPVRQPEEGEAQHQDRHNSQGDCPGITPSPLYP